jgi:putative sigma-54 modulation protein
MKVEWTCIKNGDVFQSDVSIHGDHFSVFAKSSDDSLFKTLDQVVAKLEKQIAKAKEKSVRPIKS